ALSLPLRDENEWIKLTLFEERTEYLYRHCLTQNRPLVEMGSRLDVCWKSSRLQRVVVMTKSNFGVTTILETMLATGLFHHRTKTSLSAWIVFLETLPKSELESVY